MVMNNSLRINTSVQPAAGPSSATAHSRSNTPNLLNQPGFGGSLQRMRSGSNASTASSLSVISPSSSSTNASSSSLHLPSENDSSHHTTPSPHGDETVRITSEWVLAMHDYAPQHNSATCLSFRAGQVIHVLNRDPSGWWDGELEGRRGWFPSNYVNADVDSLTEEELPEMPMRQARHTHASSVTSAASWASGSSHESNARRHKRRPSISEALGPDIDTYCPPLMVPLLHGLSLLQNAVRANRIAHFRPSTACIISCVRTILSATECLPKDAPALQQFPPLAIERKYILSVLAALVTQAKKISEEADDENRELEIETMLRLGGQVFSHVRRFLAIAVQCGLELPERRHSIDSVGGSTDTEVDCARDDAASVHEASSPIGPMTPKDMPVCEIIATPGSTLRAKSMGDLRAPPTLLHDEDSDSMPLLPHRLPGKSKERYFLRERGPSYPRHKPGVSSVSSTSSSSSYSSSESIGSPAQPPFPSGPCSPPQVMEAIRYTHDRYLSTIAAFIGHAHSHSRSSHASSTGHMYDLVREIVENVCKLLTIVEAVLRHPDVPGHKLGLLRSAKENLYNYTSGLAESVRLLTVPLPPTTTEEEEKQLLLRSATGALKAGADCVNAVKHCLSRSAGERPFIIQLPEANLDETTSPSKFSQPLPQPTSPSVQGYQAQAAEDEDLTIQAQTPPPMIRSKSRGGSSGSDQSIMSQISRHSDETTATTPDESKPLPPLVIPEFPVESDLPSPTSARTDDDGTTWEGSTRGHVLGKDEKRLHGQLPTVPLEVIPEGDPVSWMFSHDYAPDEVAYNSEGHLVGASLNVLVEKMTPHDSIVDPAFSAVFFLTFRLFTSPVELVDRIIARFNLLPPPEMNSLEFESWTRCKGAPVRLRVANFVKTWIESFWRSPVDDPALPVLVGFAKDGLAQESYLQTTALRILELLDIRRQSSDVTISPKGDRTRDPGMLINPPTAVLPSEIPRPTMTKTLLAALRSKNFASISVTDFDALELARQLTIMECNLFCAIQPDEVLETGQGTKSHANVKAVTSLSTAITGWVAESILNEHDIKKRTTLIKFFIKVADRCTLLHNFSTPRSMLAALDSSTISRLHQTWLGVPQKNKLQLEALRKLADHGRNYHEYRSKLRNTAPPAVPFLGLYLTDITFCREGNQSLRTSPLNSQKKLLNFNKFHKLARIVQDMQRFQVSYNLKAIAEVQEFLGIAFENCKQYGDLQDLYRRSLLVEPRQAADTPPPAPTSDVRQLFAWAGRSHSQT